MQHAKKYFTSDEIRPLAERSNFMGAFLVLHCFFTIALAIIVYSIWPNIFTFILAVMIIGSRQLGLAILMHDSAHRALFASDFLNEKVGWRRWGAIIFGFFGVLLVIQPGTEGFSIFSIFAVAGMIGFAGRDLATRLSPVNMSNFQLGSFGFLMVFISGILITIFNLFIFPSKSVWVTISVEDWWIIFANGFAGILAYQCLTIAMRNGDVSFVTPFRYVRVLFALFFGIILLGEEPNNLVLCGSLIVVLSGIYIILRRKKVESDKI